MFNSVGSLIGRLPRHSKISGAVLALSVRRAFEQVLYETCADLPSERLKTVRAVSFRDGALTVKCTGLLAGELAMRSGEITRATNEQLGRKVVKAVRFKSS